MLWGEGLQSLVHPGVRVGIRIEDVVNDQANDSRKRERGRETEKETWNDPRGIGVHPGHLARQSAACFD